MKGLEKVAADRRATIARQVRVVSSGYTWGRAGEAGAAAVVQRARPIEKPEVAARRAAREEAVQVAGQLLALLRAWPEDEVLASATELGRRLGLPPVPGNASIEKVAAAFRRLQGLGALVTVSGGRQDFRGQRAVLLREPRRLLQTAHAPAFWAQLLAGEMP